jgi:hypothetical protein
MVVLSGAAGPSRSAICWGGEGTAGLEHDGQDRDAGHCNAEIFFTQKCDNVLFGRNGH